MVDSASLCPRRGTGRDTEFLLTRRAYWNTKMRRPFSFPGEWVFAGGSQNAGETLPQTAKREFREELLYEGKFYHLKYFRTGKMQLYTQVYNLAFYTARLNSEPVFGLSDEIIEWKWMTPSKALQTIMDPGFTAMLEKQYAQQKLSNAAYGERSIVKRIFPLETIKTLQRLEERIAAQRFHR